MKGFGISQVKGGIVENALLFKGAITLANTFPTLIDVQVGWFYKVMANVTDNDATKTNTGQSFLAGQEIAWDGSAWVNLGTDNAVVGPASAVDENIAIYNGVTGKIIKDGGKKIADLYNLSSGPVVLPTIVQEVDGTLTIGADGIVNFYTLADATTNIVRLSCDTGDTLTLVDGSINYVYVDYNGGSPIYTSTLDRNEYLSDARKVPMFRVYRDGTTLHVSNYDLYGVGLSDKQLLKDIIINNFQRESGLILSTAVTRISTISAGRAWFGVQPYDLAVNLAGTTGELYEYYLVSGVWTKALVTSYDATYYSDGTDRQTLNSSKYVAKYFFRGVEDDNEAYYIHGGEYSTATSALAEAVPSIPLVISSHSIYVGKIVIQKDTTNGVAYPRDWGTAVSASPATDHEDLSNILQAGTGVTNGHISASTQTIVGDKTFSSLVNLNAGLNRKRTITAGENLVAGNIAYLKSDGKFWKAKANALATTQGELVLVLETINADATGLALLDGVWTTSGLTTGNLRYLSASTAGATTITAPSTAGQFIRQLGVARSSTELYFKASDVILGI